MIDEATYKLLQQRKTGRHKIRRKGTDEPYEMACGVDTGNCRFIYQFLEGTQKGKILWEEEVEFKNKGITQ